MAALPMRTLVCVSPVARALTKAREGDVVQLHTPQGVDELEILSVEYPEPHAD